MAKSQQEKAAKPSLRKRRGRVRVARNKLGQCVFAERWFAVAEIIGEIDGDVIDDFDYSSRYCMDLGDSRCLEPGPPFRFMNHSCEPNCIIRWHDIEDRSGGTRRRMFVLALDRIAPGEELTIDYGWPAHMAIPCRCGTDSCRQWIVDKLDLEIVTVAHEKAARAESVPENVSVQ